MMSLKHDYPYFSFSSSDEEQGRTWSRIEYTLMTIMLLLYVAFIAIGCHNIFYYLYRQKRYKARPLVMFYTFGQLCLLDRGFATIRLYRNLTIDCP